MPSIAAVEDLKVGMFVRLEGGWMSHPFPLSSFRIASAQQIATIRRLGLKQVTWFPDKSDLPEQRRPLLAVGGGAASPTAAQLEAAERREHLRAQREALGLCEAQYTEAALLLKQINTRIDADPKGAAAAAQQLARSMLEKMLGDGELCIRLVSGQASDRAGAHALNVTVISMLMGRSLGLQAGEMLDLGTGALLHDVGKLDLPQRVHHLEDGFGPAEQKAYRDHVALGVQRGRAMQISAGALQVLAQHHELADGSGFPNRLRLEALSSPARLVALINRYDNLCNPGPRGTPLTPHEAVSMLFAQSRGKFDMPVLSSFIRMMGVYPAGSVVQLTDERYALVTQVNSSRPLKPRVLVHDPKVPRDEALLLDLEVEPNLGIRRSLQPAKLPPAAASYLAPRPRVAYYFDKLGGSAAADADAAAEAPAVEVDA